MLSRSARDRLLGSGGPRHWRDVGTEAEAQETASLREKREI